MKIISKLLIASAVVVSFAAPSFAVDFNSDNFILQERSEAAAPMQAQVQTQAQANDWRDSYAMEAASTRGAWADPSPYANRGAAEVNGGR